ncbi:hypothetical protein E2C01_034617 [Portunus trituberculatus]|uniref:Uncharacterized protein n=1 Tax=Portunus trituberculatus TaxID=210409 RepID=A0A5B7F673_PORTR|nr:hypothetical protein [Portunus trituberculatus]
MCGKWSGFVRLSALGGVVGWLVVAAALQLYGLRATLHSRIDLRYASTNNGNDYNCIEISYYSIATTTTTTTTTTTIRQRQFTASSSVDLFQQCFQVVDSLLISSSASGYITLNI